MLRLRPGKEPWTKFTAYYRSKDSLRVAGIINRVTSHENRHSDEQTTTEGDESITDPLGDDTIEIKDGDTGIRILRLPPPKSALDKLIPSAASVRDADTTTSCFNFKNSNAKGSCKEFETSDDEKISPKEGGTSRSVLNVPSIELDKTGNLKKRACPGETDIVMTMLSSELNLKRRKKDIDDLRAEIQKLTFVRDAIKHKMETEQNRTEVIAVSFPSYSSTPMTHEKQPLTVKSSKAESRARV